MLNGCKYVSKWTEKHFECLPSTKQVLLSQCHCRVGNRSEERCLGKVGALAFPAVSCFVLFQSESHCTFSINHLFTAYLPLCQRSPRLLCTNEKADYSAYFGMPNRGPLWLTIQINILPTGLWFQLEMNQAAMHSLIFTGEELLALKFIPLGWPRASKWKQQGKCPLHIECISRKNKYQGAHAVSPRAIKSTEPWTAPHNLVFFQHIKLGH